MKRTFTRRNTAVGAIALAVSLVIGTAGGGFAGQGGLPADKTAIAGSTVEDFDPALEKPILSTRMAVSSPADLILGVSLECSILTRLVTNNTTKSGTISGSVDIRITIDGNPVPVQTAGTGSAGDNGSITFCDRTYQRTVADDETPGDGTDKTDDYTRTKAANAFNWLALNAGVDEANGGYDDLSNGNNVIDVKVFAKYDATDAPRACATKTGTVTSCSEAYVGKRTLIIEPVHAAVNETSSPLDPAVTL